MTNFVLSCNRCTTQRSTTWWQISSHVGGSKNIRPNVILTPHVSSQHHQLQHELSASRPVATITWPLIWNMILHRNTCLNSYLQCRVILGLLRSRKGQKNVSRVTVNARGTLHVLLPANNDQNVFLRLVQRADQTHLPARQRNSIFEWLGRWNSFRELKGNPDKFEKK